MMYKKNTCQVLTSMNKLLLMQHQYVEILTMIYGLQLLA